MGDHCFFHHSTCQTNPRHSNVSKKDSCRSTSYGSDDVDYACDLNGICGGGVVYGSNGIVDNNHDNGNGKGYNTTLGNNNHTAVLPQRRY